MESNGVGMISVYDKDYFERQIVRILIPTTIYQTVQEINELGGVGIPHRCDHGLDEEVAQLFGRVEREQGRLDLLVNNAWNVAEHILKGYFFNTPFWE